MQFWKYLQSWLFNDMIYQINSCRAKGNSVRSGDFKQIWNRGKMGVGKRQRRPKPLAPIKHGGEPFQLSAISQSRVSKASRSSVVSVLSHLPTSEASRPWPSNTEIRMKIRLPNPSHRNRLCISAFSQVRATMCSSFSLPFRSESTPDKKSNKENRHLQVSTTVNMLSPNCRYKP